MGQKIDRTRGASNKHNINTPSYRASLPVYKHPYWHQVSTGRFVGFKRTVKGDTWLARMRRDGRYIEKELALTTANPDELFNNALEVAQAWFAPAARARNLAYTLREALDDYEEHVVPEKGEKTAANNVNRARNKMSDEMLDTVLNDFTLRDYQKWYRGLVIKSDDEELRRKSKASANRTFAMLAAALNHAFDMEQVFHPVWRSVKKYKGVMGSRPLLLEPDEVNRLANACGPGLRELVLAAVHTGCRLGEMLRTTTADLKTVNGVTTLHVWSRKGKGGEKRHREVYLSDDGAAFFKTLSKDKLPAALLLTRPDGKGWGKNAHIRPLAAAVREARLPADTVFYSLRHFHISQGKNSGIPLDSLAKNCGTSVKMIEDTYGKASDEYMRDALNKVRLL